MDKATEHIVFISSDFFAVVSLLQHRSHLSGEYRGMEIDLHRLLDNVCNYHSNRYNLHSGHLKEISNSELLETNSSEIYSFGDSNICNPSNIQSDHNGPIHIYSNKSEGNSYWSLSLPCLCSVTNRRDFIQRDFSICPFEEEFKKYIDHINCDSVCFIPLVNIREFLDIINLYSSEHCLELSTIKRVSCSFKKSQSQSILWTNSKDESGKCRISLRLEYIHHLLHKTIDPRGRILECYPN